MSTKITKKVVMYVAAVLVLLTLVCMCLLGNTYARYTTSNSNEASATVAKWSITENTLMGTADISFSNLSPNKEQYTGNTNSDPSASTTAGTSSTDTNGYRYRTSSIITIATMTNNSEVSALVKLDGLSTPTSLTYRAYSNTYDGKSLVDNSSNSDTNIYWDADHDGTYDQSEETDTDYDLSDVYGRFKVVIVAASGTDISGDNTNGYVVPSNSTLTVTAYVVWTSNDVSSSSDKGAAADALDTFIGQYIDKVNFTLSYTAVQNSELPSA